MTTKEDWTAWYEEREHFKERDTEGFTKDLAALESHIKKLTAVCPKDKAGWPTSKALSVIAKLQQEYNQIKAYLLSNTPEV